MGGLNAKLLGRKRQPIVFLERWVLDECRVSLCSRRLCPPVTILSSSPSSATLERRSTAYELLDVAIHDLICVMREIVSGELRIRDGQWMHGSPRNPRNVQRGTSNDPSTLHQ